MRGGASQPHKEAEAGLFILVKSCSERKSDLWYAVGQTLIKDCLFSQDSTKQHSAFVAVKLLHPGLSSHKTRTQLDFSHRPGTSNEEPQLLKYHRPMSMTVAVQSNIGAGRPRFSSATLDRLPNFSRPPLHHLKTGENNI